MSILDGILGGAMGAAVTSLVNHVIEQHGGLQGLVNQLEQNGLADAVGSWIGTGANQSVNASQIQQALGSKLESLAASTGISTDVIAQKLASLLPEAINTLTPEGRIPQPA